MDNIDDSQLIELVRQFSVLYDPKHVDYRNNDIKNNAWKTIGEVMNEPASECRDRWTTLRQIYSRESKKTKVVPSGSGASTSKPWVWLKELDFLSDHVRRRRTKGNVTTCVSASEPESCSSRTKSPWDTMSSIIVEKNNKENSGLDSQESVDDILVEPVDHSEFVEFEEETEESTSAATSATPVKIKLETAISTPPTPSLPNMTILRNERHDKRRKNSQESNLITTINETWGKFDNILKQRSNENVIEDPDVLFSKMVGLELSTISDVDKKFFAKQEILKILHEVKKD